ncbi:MAG: hypothetical protein H0T17_07900 [Propionibacteriales bacterium]|nr:hypothetical protein [Propionibacteriales bacterium]
MRRHAQGPQADPALRQSQGTVWSFDPDTGAGTVVLDDGRPIDFSPEAFRAGGLRMLRRGQRMRMELDEDGIVTILTILTLPMPLVQTRPQ